MWSLERAAGAALALICAGCRQDMYDQPRYEPLEQSDLFPDGASARRPPPGTVRRADPRIDPGIWSGVDETGGYVLVPPWPVDERVLRRGQERYGIFCAPCHGLTGEGDGMIVQRGFKPPPSFHLPRLRQRPMAYFVDVATNGFGVMPSYATQAPPADRWAIAAYVTALQLSQSARPEDLSPEDLSELGRAR